MPVNGNIAPKSIVIGVADPIPLRGRQNCRPRQRERSAVLPGFCVLQRQMKGGDTGTVVKLRER